MLLTKYGFESRMLHENTKKLDENIPWTMNSVQVYIYSFKTMRLAIRVATLLDGNLVKIRKAVMEGT